MAQGALGLRCSSSRSGVMVATGVEAFILYESAVLGDGVPQR